MRTKILLTILTAVFFFATSNAQIEKGQILIGGGIGYSSLEGYLPEVGNVSKYKSGIASVNIGKVISANTIVGVMLSYSNNNYKNYYGNNSSDSNFSKGNTFGAGVFYRRYKNIFKNLYFFAELNGQYRHAETKQQGVTSGYYYSKVVSYGGTISFTPGLSYALCKNFQMELIMNQFVSTSYSHSKYYYTSGTPTVTNEGKSNTFSINANLNSNLLSGFGIGFKYFIGK
jgi:hypothetical protein